MKKAKLILAAVAVLAITGGSFAFKASASRGSVDYFTTSVFNDPAPAANVIHNGLPNANPTGRVYWTIVAGAQATAYSSISAGA
ncbi:hypothetical protein [Chitinophaga sp. LS1]|uniref:hypothetical protein n=1 Tax=Chitinophaga sp. LS1 TaxID=3051176 RepID=UPI002AAC04BF|nr:hypothetical protein [Chitinophaga sp. LS1]WPV67847.1 hypothetical protein QQL36_03805 [Chitinophaga sp. LS1]